MKKSICKSGIMNAAMGIGIASFIFGAVGFLIDRSSQGNFVLTHYAYSRMFIATILIGIGFGAPSAIYEGSDMPLPLKALVHMGIGCSVYTAAALWAGWIPTGQGLGAMLLYLAGELLLAFLIWLGYAWYYRKLAGKMNQRIREMKED